MILVAALGRACGGRAGPLKGGVQLVECGDGHCVVGLFSLRFVTVVPSCCVHKFQAKLEMLEKR